MDFSHPKPGDIVQCHFPQEKVPAPGPKARPALVLEVERFADGSSHVIVAYGTSREVDDCYPGEFTVSAAEPGAGLSVDTKFDLRQSAKLPFTDEWFAVAPGQPHGPHPKRGKLNFGKPALKRKLHAALIEAREAGAFAFMDVTKQRKVQGDPGRDGS